ncbi:MAG: RNA polymerase sporulation sigma factor SigK [Clostridia bacterium]|nr:RNA polymerase sporulation sigma factor SigK [Clostridia bacterium]
MFLSGIFALLGNLFFFTSYVKNKNCFPHPLTPQKEKELIERMWRGDAAARDELINHNMRLVVHIVKKYSGYNDNDELISVGSIGLIKAVKTYAQGKGTQFATYASRCIENEILMTLRANKKIKNTRSLYEPVSSDKDGNEIALIDLLEEDCNVIEQVENKIVKDKLTEIVKQVLDGREYEIIKMRYGLENNAVYTQLQVADKFGISRSYISRIEKKAIGKLRDYIKDNGLDF